MKFTKIYENLKLLDICKPVSSEEAARRDEEGPAIKFKEIVDAIENKTKLSDGTWHIHTWLNVEWENLTNLKQLNVSIVDGDFYCHNNHITSLEGCPNIVKGTFSCANNQLTSLEGCPTIVGNIFSCAGNQITSLKDCPKEIGKDFFCYNNKLTSLDGCPSKIDGRFYCHSNLKKFTREEVRAICDVKGYISI